VSRFTLHRCAACGRHAIARYCPECEPDNRKVLVPNVVRCAHPGCDLVSGQVYCDEHRD